MIDPYQISYLITEDPNIFRNRSIVENVEKLIPHLKDDITNYLAARREATIDFPSGLSLEIVRNQEQFDQWKDQAVEWVLQSDPKFIKSVNSGKSKTNSKAPFARSIIKWWLDPNSGGGFELPEDILTVADALNNFNIAKQHGLTAHVNDYESFDQLVNATSEYTTEEEGTTSDEYSRMGLELAFQDGPWKMYLIDKWIPGGESTLHTSETCHAAMQGTSWCVQYEGSFERGVQYYLVIKGGSRFALISFKGGKEFKDPQNRPVGSKTSTLTTYEDGADFLQRLLKDKPAVELIFGGNGNLGDFGTYSEILAPYFKTAIHENPNIIYDRLRHKTLGQGFDVGGEALREVIKPYLEHLLQSDHEFTKELFTSKHLGHLTVLADVIRPYFMQYIQDNPEYMRELLASKQFGQLGVVFSDVIEDYFNKFIHNNPNAISELFEFGNFESLTNFGDLRKFADTLKPLFMKEIKTNPKLIEALWKKNLNSAGYLGDFSMFNSILAPYFGRLNAAERTPNSRLIYKKDYKYDPTAELLGEDPVIITLIIKEVGSDDMDELSGGEGNLVGDELSTLMQSQMVEGELFYSVIKQSSKNGVVHQQFPMLTLGWSPDEDEAWISESSERKITRFGPLIRNFFQFIITEEETNEKLPEEILDKILEFSGPRN